MQTTPRLEKEGFQRITILTQITSPRDQPRPSLLQTRRHALDQPNQIPRRISRARNPPKSATCNGSTTIPAPWRNNNGRSCSSAETIETVSKRWSEPTLPWPRRRRIILAAAAASLRPKSPCRSGGVVACRIMFMKTISAGMGKVFVRGCEDRSCSCRWREGLRDGARYKG